MVSSESSCRSRQRSQRHGSSRSCRDIWAQDSQRPHTEQRAHHQGRPSRGIGHHQDVGIGSLAMPGRTRPGRAGEKPGHAAPDRAKGSQDLPGLASPHLAAPCRATASPRGAPPCGAMTRRAGPRQAKQRRVAGSPDPPGLASPSLAGPGRATASPRGVSPGLDTDCRTRASPARPRPYHATPRQARQGHQDDRGHPGEPCQAQVRDHASARSKSAASASRLLAMSLVRCWRSVNVDPRSSSR